MTANSQYRSQEDWPNPRAFICLYPLPATGHLAFRGRPYRRNSAEGDILEEADPRLT
jgi:hypothetical protein